MKFADGYWNNRYRSGETGWDLGGVSTPLKAYFDQLTDKNLEILIPGAGNSYEAEYLFRRDFLNVHVCDIAIIPLQNLKRRIPDFPQEQLLQQDFFDLEGQFDLIVEQTFFCALEPKERPEYVQKVKQLLKPGGRLAGLLFDIPLNTTHPPFGGHKKEYVQLFENDFEIKVMEKAYNSIQPRSGNELFILMSPKK